VSGGLPRGVIWLSSLSDIRVQISKKKGCRIELEDPISRGVWKIKTGVAFSSINILFHN